MNAKNNLTTDVKKIIRKLKNSLEEHVIQDVAITNTSDVVNIKGKSKGYDESLSILCQACQSCLEDDSIDAVDKYEINEAFERWLDINMKKTSLQSLKNSLTLCGITSGIESSREKVIDSLITHGISPHLNSNQISIMFEKKDSEKECEKNNYSIKAIYSSYVIGKGIISESSECDEDYSFSFSIYLKTITELMSYIS